MSEQHRATCETNGHIFGHEGVCVFCRAPKPVDSIPAKERNMSLSGHESDVARCTLCGEPMPAGEEMFKFHGYSGPCPKSTPKEPAPSPVEPAGAADDARHQQEVAISASGNCDDFEATIAELRQDLDEANAVIARYGFGGAKRIEAKLNSEVAWRDDEIKRLKALLKSLETSTPVAPAGATQHDLDMELARERRDNDRMRELLKMQHPGPTLPDVTCEHGTAMDVHCCNCHSGFIFDTTHECPPPPVRHVATCETNGHVYGHTGACVFCNAPKPVDSIPEE